MKVEELKVRVEKAQESVAKVEKTIERHKQQAAKKLAVIENSGWDAENKYCKEGTKEHHDAYWAICAYQNKLDDIVNAEKKLEEKKRILAGWKEKLVAAKQTEILFMKEVPEVFKQLERDLIADWDAYDKARRDELEKKYRDLGYKDFIREYKYAGYNKMQLTDAEIHRENERTARNLILDLYARVVKITGKVTSWNCITVKGNALNGLVTGEEGTCRVESILAGGWNIQRLHIRILTHKVA